MFGFGKPSEEERRRRRRKHSSSRSDDSRGHRRSSSGSSGSSRRRREREAQSELSQFDKEANDAIDNRVMTPEEAAAAAAAMQASMGKNPDVPQMPRLFKPFGKLMDSAIKRIPASEEHRPEDFFADSEVAMIQQEPLRARWLIRIGALTVLAGFVWAYFAELDISTHAMGKVVPSGQVQIMESLDGGIVTGIFVKEGQSVAKGQLLVQIDPTRAAATLGETRVQYVALLAREARLKASIRGASFLSMPDVVLKEAPDIARQEQGFFEDRRRDVNNQIELARQQLAQRQQELNEAVSKRDEADSIYKLTKQELDANRPLVASGAVSQIEVLRLERDANRAKGGRDQAIAQIARARAAIGEARNRISAVRNTAVTEAGKELQQVSSKLKELVQRGKSAEDKVRQTAIRSQVRGTVKRLLVTTKGGVVKPGQPVVEIVPIDETLIVEAKIIPKDVAFLHPGQRALVKFTAYDFSIYGGLKGTLNYISPDTVPDEEGTPFYLVHVRTDEPNFGENLPITPGMLADVNILTGKKSVLDYLLKPILKAKSRALSER